MPSRRRPTQPSVLDQISGHIIRNGMTTMLGLSVGLPFVIQGVQTGDYGQVSKGMVDIVLGLSGQDTFGMRRKQGPTDTIA